MRIGIFTDCYTPTKNGVVTSILQGKTALEERGHRIVVVTVTSPHQHEEKPGIYRVPSLPFRSDIEIRIGLVNQRRVNRIVRQEQLDILHSHTEFSLGRAAKRAAKRLNLPHVHTLHTLYEQYRHYLRIGKCLSPKMIQRYVAWFVQGCHTLICPSKKVQDYAASFLPSFHSVVIGNGVNRRKFHPNLLSAEEKRRVRSGFGIHASDRVMMYVGRMAQEKRSKELLSSLLPLLHNNPDYKALLVGNGPSYTQLVNLVKTEGVQRQVIFPGYMAWEAIPLLYSIADVFVTVSLSENHPMTLIEAIMCGLPIVARRDESYRELVEDGYNGFLVDSDELFGERVAQILCDEEMRDVFSERSVRMSQHCTVEKYAEKLEVLYQAVVKNPQSISLCDE